MTEVLQGEERECGCEAGEKGTESWELGLGEDVGMGGEQRGSHNKPGLPACAAGGLWHHPQRTL